MAKIVVPSILKKIAPRIGATVHIEPDYGYVGYIQFKNGKRTFFSNASFDINPFGAAKLARDKGYAHYLLHQFGYQTPNHMAIFSTERNNQVELKRTIEDGAVFCKKIGFPVIVKPNDKSQGFLVTRADSVAEFKQAAKRILKEVPVALIEKFCAGNDYRIVILDGHVISAYQRIPLNVVGDGKRTIAQLLSQKQALFERLGRDTRIQQNDPRISSKLRKKGLSLHSVLPKGKKTLLLDNANLSTGGDAVECTTTIHDDYGKLAARITEDFGLRLCGVDILVEDITSRLDSRYVVLEVNASPGMDNYAASGAKQQKRVEELYLKVLLAIEKQKR